MLCCTKHPEKIIAMTSWLILGGVLPLAVAYSTQIGLHLAPCHFCMLQRYPYVLVIACGLLSLVVPRMSLRWRACVAFGILGLLATGILGLIHTGIETGFLHYTGGCVAQVSGLQSVEAIRASIMAAPLVACNDVSAQFLGLSMASWNSMWAALMILLIAVQYRCEWRHYAR